MNLTKLATHNKLSLLLNSFGNKDLEVYKSDTGLTIFISLDGNRKHLSISHQERYPTYDEMAMIFPKAANYVNIHNNCFHLFEI